MEPWWYLPTADLGMCPSKPCSQHPPGSTKIHKHPVGTNMCIHDYTRKPIGGKPQKTWGSIFKLKKMLPPIWSQTPPWNLTLSRFLENGGFPIGILLFEWSKCLFFIVNLRPLTYPPQNYTALLRGFFHEGSGPAMKKIQVKKGFSVFYPRKKKSYHHSWWWSIF